jgi:hypothetical protein
MTVRELIDELNIVAEKYGDNYECVLSVDDDHCHTELNLEEVNIHSILIQQHKKWLSVVFSKLMKNQNH